LRSFFKKEQGRMDASKITQLLQKQHTRYINRSQTVDSSTQIWRNQIQSSKYIKGVATCTGLKNTDVPTQAQCPGPNGQRSYGGSGKQMTLSTGSPQQYPSVFAGAAGSAAEVYSSERIMLQKAGQNLCAGMIPPQDAYTVLPPCDCTNTNGPALTNPDVPGNASLTGNPNNLAINNQSNPYLPPFDTYYRFKNPCSTSRPDANAQHFVKECHSRFPNANNGVNVLCTDCTTPTYLVDGQTISPPYVPAGTCNGCVLTPSS
jgi:hypothetical protein